MFHWAKNDYTDMVFFNGDLEVLKLCSLVLSKSNIISYLKIWDHNSILSDIQRILHLLRGAYLSVHRQTKCAELSFLYIMFNTGDFQYMEFSTKLLIAWHLWMSKSENPLWYIPWG